MDLDTFKLIHSELIQQVQCVEYNLKVIYAAMKKGNFNKTLQSLERANLGKIARELHKLDNSDDFPEFTQKDYEVIDDIRNIRNYWCHQCYVDFVYIQDRRKKERAFQDIAERLHYDEYRTYDLYEKTEEMKAYVYEKYRG